MDRVTFDALTPAERRAFVQRQFAGKACDPENRRFASVDRVDLALLAELPITPPDEKDRQLRELHDRLHQGRPG